MTLEAHKALVREWLTAVWQQSDLAAVDRLFAPSYTVNGVPCPPEAVKQAVRMLQTAFSPATVSIEDLVAEDDKVVVRWSLRGTQGRQRRNDGDNLRSPQEMRSFFAISCARGQRETREVALAAQVDSYLVRSRAGPVLPRHAGVPVVRPRSGALSSCWQPAEAEVIGVESPANTLAVIIPLLRPRPFGSSGEGGRALEGRRAGRRSVGLLPDALGARLRRELCDVELQVVDAGATHRSAGATATYPDTRPGVQLVCTTTTSAGANSRSGSPPQPTPRLTTRVAPAGRSSA